MIYEGKSKSVFKTEEDGIVNIFFKNDITAFNGEKHDVVKDKGLMNCYMSAFFMRMFTENNIPNHFLEMVDDQTQRCVSVDIIPVEVVVRNIAAGSFCKRFGIEKGTRIKTQRRSSVYREPGINGDTPLVEFFFKSDEHGDPPMSKEHAIMFGMATSEELEHMRYVALQVNNVLVDYWSKLDIDLVDFKIEFGRTKTGTVILADEMTPDACRLWKTGTQESMDKDVYRFGPGVDALAESYKALYDQIKSVEKA